MDKNRDMKCENGGCEKASEVTRMRKAENKQTNKQKNATIFLHDAAGT